MSVDHQEFEILVVKATDGLLDEAEAARLTAHLEECPSCRAEVEDFARIKEKTDMLRTRIEVDARLSPPREAPMERRWTFFATLVVAFGALTLMVWFGLEFLRSSPPMPVLIGVLAVVLGSLALILAPLVRRIRGAKKDPYKEIDL